MAADVTSLESPGQREVRRGHLLFRAPRPPVTLALTVVASAGLAALLWLPDTTRFFEGFLLAILVPALVGTFATPALARWVGGRFEFHRSAFLTLTLFVLMIPIALIWRGAHTVWPGSVPSLLLLAAFVAGPAFWFRHLTLYGVSRASHSRTVGVSLLPVALYLLGVFVITPPSVAVVAATLLFLLIAFACSVALIRAADRPMRREFHISGVSLIRPLLDHVGDRDSSATDALEAFFLRTAVEADLKVRLLAFYKDGRPHATLALPTVHPGPFAALGARDLPRKLSERLGPEAGTVLVPHTPSDHDLDLPSEREVGQVADASRALLRRLRPSQSSRSGPLVAPYPKSLARAQLLGDAVLVTVSRAPAPTDDIAYSVADRLVRELTVPGGPAIALIDGHNSYIEGEGDILYGTPSAEQLVKDATAAVATASAAATSDPVEVGVAVRVGYSIGRDGIGPQGLRAVAVRAGGKVSAYLLIDGNNLVVGLREPIVRALEKIVDVAEVMTTDNHVVHEVDGGINPVGERYPLPRLIEDATEVVRRAVADLAPVEVRYGEADVPSVRVLGPGHTARLLTSLGDTLSMFTNMFPAMLLLLLTGSLVVAFALA